ncbi:YhgE/Pip domain-containing protein [Bacillus mojavensis]|uniref:YhgE/Pip domain-containing protein n=1 Tax=Bacillus mojavensis TaxID=72360 RepID=UPI002DBC9EC8|nr:YhgE/Pip domain-containing protein [Bacillus mojavensis]MEC1614959.1 YhgE/Pip domain-containing protein [Bacillus mojavensis]MEC1684092.1 YhgE/Pip domain-containing protein [Bacillus mojavensis]MEC1692978.1 YhgE/Pip domain-containing protein [Bacillus mojavensis]MEC1708007.1 YhgE/Pip domain-containing protein [Bacillus mojavensis]
MHTIRSQWKDIVTRKKLLIPIIAILFVPLIYSGVFLKAYWDPYGTVDQLPVVVVNQDKGTTYEGEKLQIGDDLVKELKDNKSFDWHFSNDLDQSLKDLLNQKYYLVVEIPEDFSKNASTVMDKNPKKLDLKYHTNAGSNYVGATIGEKAIDKLKASVSKEVTEQYTKVIFDNFKDIAKGLSDASSGAKKIDDGTKDAKNGSAKLKENLEKLTESTATISDKTAQLAAGAAKVTSGIQSLDSSLGKFQDSSNTIYENSGKIAAGSSELTGKLNELLAGQQTLQQGFPKITNGLDQLNTKAAEASQKVEKAEKVINAVNLTQLETAVSNLEKSETAMNEFKKQLTEFENSLKNRDQAFKNVINSSEFLTAEQKSQLIHSVEKKLPQVDAPDFDQIISRLPSVDQLPDISTIKASLEDVKEQAAQLKAMPEATSKLYNGAKATQDAIDKLTEGTEKIYNGSQQITDSQNKLTAGIGEYNKQFAKAKAGSEQLVTGGSQVSGGLLKLLDGSKQVQNGSSKLAEGSESLDTGLGKLLDGTGQLSNKLNDAADQTGDISADDETYGMFADPVKTNDDAIHSVPNYGTGLTPYILSMGLYVGGIMLTVVFPLKEASGRPRNGFEWFFSKFNVMMLVGIIQSLIVATVLLLGIGLEVESTWRFYVFTIITSLAFLAMIQFLATTMGNPGRFIAVIILVLQLGASGGTFPLELLPHFYQVIHGALPMTYSINGFRAVISNGDFGYMWQMAGVLIGIALVMIALSITYFTILSRKEDTSEEQPAS